MRLFLNFFPSHYSNKLVIESMDAAWVRTVSHKDRDGEVITDAEETTIAAAPSRTPQRSSATPTEVALSSATTSNVVDEIPAEGVIEDDDDEEEEEGENNNEEEDEDDEEYEYEDDDDAHFSGFLVENLAYGVVTASTTTALEGSSNSDKPATIEEDEQQQEQKPKWREPSKEAVSMSLRAEKETSGGKRRLAQDLYRIMNQDTEVAGFLLHPSKEDSMDQWTIHLFQFDEDSKLAKDMKVLGASSIELEMSFPNQYPFEPPFVRVASPRFRRQTGFVMNGALCMELLTNVRTHFFPSNGVPTLLYFSTGFPHLSFSPLYYFYYYYKRTAGIQSMILKAL